MKLVLADDHALFLEGLQNLLAARGVEVAGVARDGLEALEKARALRPDVILMDIRMPRCDGLAATRLIKTELPATKIVMLTSSPEEADLFEAIKSGACGYLLKTLQSAELLDYLVGLERGELPVAREIAGKLLHEFARQAAESAAEAEALTARQRQVLTLVAQGLTNQEIGRTLGLSEHTVKYHLGQIIQQLHLKNRAQAVAYALRTGLVRETPPD
jgi:DNA-binding NarL/FixJ family response regulator